MYIYTFVLIMTSQNTDLSSCDTLQNIRKKSSTEYTVSVMYSPASHHDYLGSIPEHSTWNFSWTKWHWGTFPIQVLWFSPTNSDSINAPFSLLSSGPGKMGPPALSVARDSGSAHLKNKTIKTSKD
jgi:hypothetical protein